MIERFIPMFGNDENDIELEKEPMKIIIRNLMFRTEVNNVVDDVKNDAIAVINTVDVKNKDDLNYILAFLEGAAYSICGTFKQVAESTYMLASKDVSIQDNMC